MRIWDFGWFKHAAPAIRNMSLNPSTRFRGNITNVFWIQFSDIITTRVVQDDRDSSHDDQLFLDLTCWIKPADHHRRGGPHKAAAWAGYH